MKKAKRKWRRWLNKLKKLGIGTRAMNLGMFIIGWILVVFLAVAYVRGFGMKTIISNDSMVPTFHEEEILKIKDVYKRQGYGQSHRQAGTYCQSNPYCCKICRI